MTGRNGFDRAFDGVGQAVGSAVGDVTVGAMNLLVDYLMTPSSPKISVPLPVRFEHTHIIGGSGHGKTQFLQHLLITEDLPAVARGERSVIVIDSQGDLLRKLLHLSMFRPADRALSERLVYLDAADVEAPPCLNLFDFGLSRIRRYGAAQQEMLVNGAVYLFEYLFRALLGAELTAKQETVFRFLARLLMAVPEATIYTLMDFMSRPELIRPYLPLLGGPTRKFLETQFFSGIYDATRQQINARLWAVLSNDGLARIFSHRENKVNLFHAMNRGSVILINSAKEHLKQEGCSIFGRFMIALIAQATQERAAIPERRRLPTFVYIDEAQDYFDEGMESLVSQGRKYNVGLILAHQNMGQFEARLRKSVMASTAIKYAGGLSDEDAKALAREMHTTPEFLQSLKKTRTETRFGLFVKNLTDTAVERVVPLGVLERQPRLTQAEYEALILQNRERYCAPVDQALLAGSTAVEQSGFTLDPSQPV